MKSKFKSAFGIKQPAEANSSSQKRAEIDPPPKQSVQISVSQTPEHSDCLSGPEDDHFHTSLSTLAGFQTLENDLLSTTPCDPSPKVSNYSETALQRRETYPRDSIRSDVAVFGEDEDGADNEAITVTLDEAQSLPVDTENTPKAPPPLAGAREVPVRHRNILVPTLLVQSTSIQDAPVEVQQRLASGTGGEMTKLTTPGPAPVFNPSRPKDTPIHPPGILPHLILNKGPLPLDPHHAQQQTPANLPLSPSPHMIIPTLGASPWSKGITTAMQDTPMIPPTMLEYQGIRPEAYWPLPNTLAGQLPALPPRSPQRPPPHKNHGIKTADGEKKNLGVIGDRRATKNPPQPQVAERPNNEPGDKEDVPLVKVDSPQAIAQAHCTRHPPVPTRAHPEPIYVGKYYVGRPLGEGGTGKVYSVVNKELMMMNALKVIKRKYLRFDNLSLVKDELAIMRAISENKFFGRQQVPGLSFVNHLVESWYDKDNIYLVMVRSPTFVVNLN